MSKIWPPPTILDFGRIVAAIDKHRGELDEFALAYKAEEDKKSLSKTRAIACRRRY